MLCTLSVFPGRPISHVSAGGSSGRSSISDERERSQPAAEESFEVDPDDVILKQTTAVVKTVMELSNKVPISRPSEYVDLVKVIQRKERGERRDLHLILLIECGLVGFVVSHYYVYV